jgi:hypothetical protein
MAGIFQVSGEPGSTIITEENLLSALNLMDWFVNHAIAKIDSARELSDEEKNIILDGIATCRKWFLRFQKK